MAGVRVDGVERVFRGRRGDAEVVALQGMDLRARYTFFAEGCRGHLGRRLQERYNLRAGADPQVYGIGLKELWEIKPELNKPGLVMHTAGWPLTSDTYGGSFLYHLEDNQVVVGFVIGLDYENPYLNPFEELQRFKTGENLSRNHSPTEAWFSPVSWSCQGTSPQRN